MSSPRKPGEITLAKKAAERLNLWVNAEGADANLEVNDLRLVLAHYAKLTRTKVSRKGLYVKGRSFEYELRDYFVGRGLACRRVMQSGGGVEKDDLVLTPSWGDELRLEAKRVAKLPAYLLNPTADATIFREDRGETLVMIRLPLFGDMLQ
jgi:hypothetical protein